MEIGDNWTGNWMRGSLCSIGRWIGRWCKLFTSGADVGSVPSELSVGSLNSIGARLRSRVYNLSRVPDASRWVSYSDILTSREWWKSSRVLVVVGC